MGDEDKQELLAERADLILDADKSNIVLTEGDFDLIDGGWYIDGMPAAEWADAMGMD